MIKLRLSFFRCILIRSRFVSINFLAMHVDIFSSHATNSSRHFVLPGNKKNLVVSFLKCFHFFCREKQIESLVQVNGRFPVTFFFLKSDGFLVNPMLKKITNQKKSKKVKKFVSCLFLRVSS